MLLSNKFIVLIFENIQYSSSIQKHLDTSDNKKEEYNLVSKHDEKIIVLW